MLKNAKPEDAPTPAKASRRAARPTSTKSPHLNCVSTKKVGSVPPEQGAAFVVSPPASAPAAGFPESAQASVISTKPTKAAQVLDLLGRPEGVTLAALAAATGWQPHTMRAHLTGLRKKGYSLESKKMDGVRHYSIRR